MSISLLPSRRCQLHKGEIKSGYTKKQLTRDESDHRDTYTMLQGCRGETEGLFFGMSKLAYWEGFRIGNV